MDSDRRPRERSGFRKTHRQLISTQFFNRILISKGEDRMFMEITLGVFAVVALLLVVIAARTANFRVERSAVIDAPSKVVFALLNDFHQWDKWSPYERRDPDMKRTYDGPPAGPGSVYSWAGNAQIGEGRMTITESKPRERIAIRI